MAEGKSEKLKQLMQVLDLSASIAGLDHDIRNQLTVFSLGMRIIAKVGERNKDEKLLKLVTQMQESLDSIENILTKLQPLKENALIKEKRGNN